MSKISVFTSKFWMWAVLQESLVPALPLTHITKHRDVSLIKRDASALLHGHSNPAPPPPSSLTRMGNKRGPPDSFECLSELG